MSDNEMFSQFLLEAQDLFDDSEDALLDYEKNQNFEQSYVILFRCFHSIKGAAGMFGVEKLEKHMHTVENNLSSVKESNIFSPVQIDYFFKAVDHAKAILSGTNNNFDHLMFNSGSLEMNNVTPIEPKRKIKKKKIKNNLDYHGTVFVVDDEESVMSMIKALVEAKDFEVKTFSNGQDLLDALEVEHPDTIITDFNMPEISGIQIMKKVNEMYPMLPMIMVSGFVRKELCIESLETGVDGILEKPFQAQSLITQVSNSVNRYKTIKLMNRSLDLIVYQFKNFDKFLEEQCQVDQQRMFRDELKNILEQKKRLFSSRRKGA